MAMQVYLDDTLIQGPAQTLSDALTLVAQRTEGRLVVSAAADGVAVSTQDLLDPPATEPYAQEIHFRTADPVLIAREALFEAADLLERVAPKQAKVAELLQVGRTGEALPMLTEVIEGWSRGEQTLGLCMQVGIGESHKQRIEKTVEQLRGRLAEMTEALKAQDLTTVADLLAYDLNEDIQDWTNLLRELTASGA